MYNIKFIASYDPPKSMGGSTIERSSLRECIDYLRDKERFTLDTETTSLDPHQARLIMVQVGDVKTQFVID
jgi:ribonuclease D